MLSGSGLSDGDNDRSILYVSRRNVTRLDAGVLAILAHEQEAICRSLVDQG